MNDPVDIQIKIHQLENELHAQSRLIIELTSKINGLERRLYANKKPGDGKYPAPRPGAKLSEKQFNWLKSLLAERDEGLEKRIINKYEVRNLESLPADKFNEIKDALLKVPTIRKKV